MAESYASEFRTFFYNLMRYGFKLSFEEIKQILITVSIIAFIWSFDNWGGETFDAVEGIKNFFFGFVFALVAVVANQVWQRVVAVHYGYDPYFESGMLGLMIGLVVAFASRGLLVFFLPGAINIRHLTASRLGEFRYYTNLWEWAKVSFMGPVGNVFMIIILAFFKDIPILREFMIMNIMFAVYSLIPLPFPGASNSGIYLFYPHVFLWMFAFGIVVTSSLLALFLNPLFILPLAMVVGAYITFYYFTKVENRP